VDSKSKEFTVLSDSSPTLTEQLNSLSETAVLVVKAVLALELQGQHEVAVAFMAALEGVQ
jgi:hypothetical protein